MNVMPNKKVKYQYLLTMLRQHQRVFISQTLIESMAKILPGCLLIFAPILLHNGSLNHFTSNAQILNVLYSNLRLLMTTPPKSFIAPLAFSIVAMTPLSWIFFFVSKKLVQKCLPSYHIVVQEINYKIATLKCHTQHRRC